MFDYIEPSQADFDEAEQAVVDIMSTKYPSITTRTGSAIRELLVRPLSYIYSWISANTRELRNKSSIKYLLSSNLTENELADNIAANFFVYRKQGARSKGSLTLFLNRPYMQLTEGSVFHVGGFTLITEKRIIAIDSDYKEVDSVLYVPVIPYDTNDNTYMVTIPVISTEEGQVDIKAGTEMDTGPGGAITGGFLSSDVTGGLSTETDSAMMKRASYNTAQAGIGSVYGIRHRLDGAPVTVLDVAVVSGKYGAGSSDLWQNTVAIGTGGVVDCYVKTSFSMDCDTLVVDVEYDTERVDHTIEIGGNLASTEFAGFYRINGIIANGEHINDYTIEFGSTDKGYSGESSRLSNRQLATISFQTSRSVSKLRVGVTIAYMKGINTLQIFMDSDVNKFIGQDVRVKAAVPVELKLDCVVDTDTELDNDTLDKIKTCICEAVRQMPIGSRYFNFSDIYEAVQTTVSGAKLRLPCTMSAGIPLNSGRVDSVYSTSGLLDISDRPHEDYWDPSIYYFSLLSPNIRLEQA